MWKAIESFDPHADHWSEPADFGSQEDRINVALDAIKKLKGQPQGALDEGTEDDIRAFEDRLEELRQRSSFSKEMKKFCRRLLQQYFRFVPS